jgi:hypothetical protein
MTFDKLNDNCIHTARQVLAAAVATEIQTQVNGSWVHDANDSLGKNQQ